MNELKLARPREVPMLRMAGYRPVMQWSDSFIMMHLESRETKDSAADQLVEPKRRSRNWRAPDGNHGGGARDKADHGI